MMNESDAVQQSVSDGVVNHQNRDDDNAGRVNHVWGGLMRVDGEENKKTKRVMLLLPKRSRGHTYEKGFVDEHDADDEAAAAAAVSGDGAENNHNKVVMFMTNDDDAAPTEAERKKSQCEKHTLHAIIAILIVLILVGLGLGIGLAVQERRSTSASREIPGGYISVDCMPPPVCSLYNLQGNSNGVAEDGTDEGAVERFALPQCAVLEYTQLKSILFVEGEFADSNEEDEMLQSTSSLLEPDDSCAPANQALWAMAVRYHHHDDDQMNILSQSSASVADDDLALLRLEYYLTILYYALEGDSWIFSPLSRRNIQQQASSSSTATTLRQQQQQQQQQLEELSTGDEYDDDDWWFSRSNTNRPCQWKGVTCSSGDNPRLFSLELEAIHAAGTIPTEIAFLSDLTFLNLGFNDIIGTIPTEMGTMKRLSTIELNNNVLKGNLPSEMGQLLIDGGNLRNLHLQHNKLGPGPIPSELLLLELDDDDDDDGNNKVDTKDTPSRLRILDLSYNSFMGTLPNFGHLRFLQQLYLQHNQFQYFVEPTGSRIPKSVVELDVSFNDLEISVTSDKQNGTTTTTTSDTLLRRNNWNNLKIFRASNMLRDVQDISEEQAESRRDFVVSHLLHPSDGISPSTLQIMDLSKWNIGEGVSIEEIFTALVGRNNKQPPFALRDLILDGNALTGTIPSSSLLFQSTVLQSLVLSDNALDGPLPASLGQLTSLTKLHLSNAFRTDSSIPNEICSLPNLVDTDFDC